MNVYAVLEPHRMSVVVYVQVGETDHGSKLFMSNDYSVTEVAMGQEPPFYLRLPTEIAEQVGKAIAPRPEATERHLDDAIEIRDRLLTVVETIWKDIK